MTLEWPSDEETAAASAIAEDLIKLDKEKIKKIADQRMNLLATQTEKLAYLLILSREFTLFALSITLNVAHVIMPEISKEEAMEACANRICDIVRNTTIE